jgi:hypothetical protein
VNADDSNDVPLSDAAARRRNAILADALRAADRRRRARVARHVVGVACVCLLAVGTFAIVSRNGRSPVQPTPLGNAMPGPTSSPTPAPTPSPATNPDTPRVVVQIIPADHVERRWQVINDDQLIAALAAAGKPGTVARLNGKEIVLPLQ